MKFFVCGCNGMAGHTISLYLQEQGHDIFGFDLEKSKYIKSFAGTAFDTETIAKVIKERIDVGNGFSDYVLNKNHTEEEIIIAIGIIANVLDVNHFLIKDTH